MNVRLQVLRSIDKLDRLGSHGVFELLTTGRKDESGAFTEGCGLSIGQAIELLYVVNAGSNTVEARRVRVLFLLGRCERKDGSGTALDDFLDMVEAGKLDLCRCVDQLAERMSGDAR